MRSDTYGFAPLNLLSVGLVFGLVLLFPWPELWRKSIVREAAAKGPRLLKPQTGMDCPLCRGSRGPL